MNLRFIKLENLINYNIEAFSNNNVEEFYLYSFDETFVSIEQKQSRVNPLKRWVEIQQDYYNVEDLNKYNVENYIFRNELAATGDIKQAWRYKHSKLIKGFLDDYIKIYQGNIAKDYYNSMLMSLGQDERNAKLIQAILNTFDMNLKDFDFQNYSYLKERIIKNSVKFLNLHEKDYEIVTRPDLGIDFRQNHILAKRYAYFHSVDKTTIPKLSEFFLLGIPKNIENSKTTNELILYYNDNVSKVYGDEFKKFLLTYIPASYDVNIVYESEGN